MSSTTDAAPTAKREDPAELDDSLVELASAMRTCIIRLARQMRVERSNESLSFSQLSALGVIDGRAPLSPSQLAAVERIQPSSAARVITQLSDLGLVTRTTSAGDRRHAVLRPTPAGHAIVLKDRERRTEWLVTLLRGFSEEQLADINAAMPHLESLVQIGVEAHISDTLGRASKAKAQPPSS